VLGEWFRLNITFAFDYGYGCDWRDGK